MQNIRECIQELKEGIRDGVRDHSVVGRLKKTLGELALESQMIQPYTQLLFKLYDLSNSPHLLSQAPNLKPPHQPLTLDPLAIALKALTLKMLASLVSFFNESSSVPLPPAMISQALEIMIMVSRVLLDVDEQGEVRAVYGLVMTFREAMGLEVALEVEMAHWLNLVELMAGDVDTRNMDVGHYKNALDQLQQLMAEPNAPQCYSSLLQHLTFEVVLKLLKKCRTAQARLLLPYLTEKMRSTITSLMTLELPLPSSESDQIKLSPFYELYLQITQNGYQNIEESSLRLFLSQETNFNDQRVFDVVAMTMESQILEMWFEIELKTKARSQQKEKAYRCFVYVVDKNIGRIDERDNSLECGREQDLEVLGKMLTLSKVVMVSMLSEKKDSGSPITLICKRLCKLLTYLVMHLHPSPDLIQEFTEKLLLLCSKHSLSELSRSVVTLHFYYQLLMGTVTEEAYGQLCRANLVDKGSELFRCMKMAYLFRTGKEIPPQEEHQLLLREPFIMVLFAKEPHQQVILRCPAKEMVKMRHKWEVYILLLNGEGEHSVEVGKLGKVLSHMEETIVADEWGGLTKGDVDNLEHLVAMLMPVLTEEKENLNSEVRVQLCLVLLYLTNMTAVHSKLDSLSSAVLLNRYSKLIKLLSLAQEVLPHFENEAKRTKHEEMNLYLAKQYLTSCHQHLKVKYLQGDIPSEAGFLLLIDVVHQMIAKHKGTTLGQAQFFRFVRFEILCLVDGYSESELYQEQSPKLLKLYCSSIYIPKQLKLKIMRKLIRQDLITDSKLLSFSDVVGLIQLSDDVEEKQIFASYLIRAFGEQGRRYVMMESERDPKVFGLLEEDDQF